MKYELVKNFNTTYGYSETELLITDDEGLLIDKSEEERKNIIIKYLHSLKYYPAFQWYDVIQTEKDGVYRFIFGIDTSG